jgi:methyl-accepting chemotaxis protein
MIEDIRNHTQAAVSAMGSGTERVSRGMQITARAGESLKRIIAAADQVDTMIAHIATASTQQSVAAQQSSQNLEVINRLGEEQEASTPITRGFIDSVESGAQRLQEHIAQFRITETGAKSGFTRPGCSGIARAAGHERFLAPAS